MTTRDGGRFWVAAGCALLIAGVGLAREAVPMLHHKLPMDAVLAGPLLAHGETVAELTLDGSAVEVVEGVPGRYVPVQWEGPLPEGFAANLRARVHTGQGGLLFGAQILVDLELTATPERPLLLRGRVVDTLPTGGPRRTEFIVVSPRVASAEELLEYLQEPTMRPLDTVFSCVEPNSNTWTWTFPVSGEPSVIAPDGRILGHANARTESSVSIAHGVTTRSFRLSHTFGEENPVRLEVVADDTDGCGPSESGSDAADHGDTLESCLGGSTLPVEIHTDLEATQKGLFEEGPPPTGSCTLSLVQSGFDRPGR